MNQDHLQLLFTLDTEDAGVVPIRVFIDERCPDKNDIRTIIQVSCLSKSFSSILTFS